MPEMGNAGELEQEYLVRLRVPPMQEWLLLSDGSELIEP